MAFVEDIFKSGNIGTGLAVGIGMAVLGPVVVPMVGAVVRPLAKGVIKAGMMAYDTAAEGVSRAGDTTAGEGIGGVFREARAELDASRSGPGRPSTAGETSDRQTKPA